MSRTTRALRVLKEAREVVARRLSQRVVMEQLDILEDARGDSFMDEIETLYRQLGRRLQQLNQMIQDLEAVERDNRAGRSPDIPKLSCRLAERGHLTPTSLQSFAAQIKAGNLQEASGYLVELFGISPGRAIRCARHFAELVGRNPLVILQIVQMRKEMETNQQYAAYQMLRECFGLEDQETRRIMDILKDRFNKTE